MKLIETPIVGAVVLEMPIFRDDRGQFQETYNERRFLELGLPIDWKQDNLSMSRKNVVRGLHYQLIQPQGKLVRVISGAVFDVAVDLRRHSATFGKHVSVELSAENGLAFYIPAGFAHGFTALTDDACFAYKVTDFYEPSGDRTLLWNDPELGIEWPIDAAQAIVSAKDQLGKSWKDAEVFP
ncbi:dTDP-4-dehydrorhamnose 3,5-epimerase [Acidisarcina polymorpha]|uniref:dTDP-4-dehydrorhamnose 3,5-epimerase n=1 Tax=Acidisarcina polymorpha TaxID=2211140 RepID=A0A2Z5G291_9BACT|nr:dTDP-4-dehydrorhamnose 3,5-epimerase [Acidisarcina polymorpha]AXC12934.1 dTDP-4-dehydrorhamnose 3,5-epimerase [Acidisarcina polymorpha]